MTRINVTAKDGTNIPVITVGIDSKPKKATVIISHGFGEHAGTYIEFANELLKADYTSIIADQRGHGTPPKGATNWEGTIPNYQCFIDDIETLTSTARVLAPDTPIALYGHSMGGNIVVNTLLRTTPDQAKGYFCAVLEAPWFGLYKPIDYFYVTLINILSRIAPNHRVKQKLNKEAISSIQKRADNYTNDPLRHGYLSMRLLSGVLKACDYALENASKLPIPTYIAYASNDIIVSNDAILKFASKAKSMVTLKEYESSHAIHNDINREMFIKDVVRYMDGRLSG